MAFQGTAAGSNIQSFMVTMDNRDVSYLDEPVNHGIQKPEFNISNLTIDSRLSDLPLHKIEVNLSTPGFVIANKFEENQNLPGVIVFDQGNMYGMISRRFCLEILSQPFGTEVYFNRPVSAMLTKHMTNPLVLSSDYPISEAVQVALNRSPDSVYEPVVIEFPDRSYKLLDIYILLLAQTWLLSMTNGMIRKQKEISEALYNATTSLVTTLDINILLERILKSAVSAIPAASRAILFMFDEITQTFHIGAIHGYEKCQIGEAVFGWKKRLTDYILQHKTSLLIKDGNVEATLTSTDYEYENGIVDPGIRSIMIVPLMLEEKMLGAISLDSPKTNAFSESDLELLIVFGRTATAAIRNAKLHGDLEKLATLDPLTGMLNRRGFYDKAHSEIERALRYGRPLSTILIDIDHFKRINDTYGHDFGDRVIQMVARICKDITRSTDLASRYGGEEFVILLPEIGWEEAKDVAERLRRNISAAIIKKDDENKKENISVTASFGVAELEESHETVDATLEKLLNNADQAMYFSKTRGRNRVTIWSDYVDEMDNSSSAEINHLTETLLQREEELRRQAASRQAAEEHLSSILQNASEAIISVNAYNQILVFNKSAELIFGYGVSEVMGKPLDYLMPEQDCLPVAVFEGLDDKHSVGRRIITGKRKDGTIFPVEASYSKFGINGQSIYTVILTDITERQRAEEKIRHYNLELSLAYDKTIEGWAHALELRDLETHGHSKRVVDMTIDLATLMGVNQEELVHIRRGALLHDIGKISIPDGIVLKPGPLSDEEWDIMRRHPLIAYELLYPIEFLHPALDIPYYHHECWDGTGYPVGLKGAEIPLAARIFSVIDVWDALKSDRPYRKAWETPDILEYIRQGAGNQFDPQVVNTFFRLVNQ